MNEATRALTIRAVGDICLTGVDGDPFAHVRDALDADLVFGNLECCFSTRGTAAVGKVVFNADPTAAQSLEPFDVLCLANNHTLDFGPDGLEDTLAVLEANGLTYAGAGRNQREATAVRWIDAAGTRIAVLCTADVAGGDVQRPGVAALSLKTLAARVQDVRAEADVVIASYHGGIELDSAPSPSVVRGLRGLVDAGADVVLAHHPHVLQAAESYRGGVIAYSLGNFVFDNRRYGEHAEVASMTTILEVTLALDDEGRYRGGYNYIPVEIGSDFKPRVVENARADRILGHLAGLERELKNIDGGAVDRQRLENMTREIRQKSLKTLVRYAIRHRKDYSVREMLVGAGLVVRGVFRRGKENR